MKKVMRPLPTGVGAEASFELSPQLAQIVGGFIGLRQGEGLAPLGALVIARKRTPPRAVAVAIPRAVLRKSGQRPGFRSI